MTKFRKKPVVIEAFQWGVDITPVWWRKASKHLMQDMKRVRNQKPKSYKSSLIIYNQVI